MKTLLFGLSALRAHHNRIVHASGLTSEQADGADARSGALAMMMACTTESTQSTHSERRHNAVHVCRHYMYVKCFCGNIVNIHTLDWLWSGVTSKLRRVHEHVVCARSTARLDPYTKFSQCSVWVPTPIHHPNHRHRHPTHTNTAPLRVVLLPPPPPPFIHTAAAARLRHTFPLKRAQGFQKYPT